MYRLLSMFVSVMIRVAGVGVRIGKHDWMHELEKQTMKPTERTMSMSASLSAVAAIRRWISFDQNYGALV